MKRSGQSLHLAVAASLAFSVWSFAHVHAAETNSTARADSPAPKTAAPATSRASAAKTAPAVSSRIFRLAQASAVEVAERLNEMWSGDFGSAWKQKKTAVAFSEANAILVTGPKEVLDACAQAIAALDVEAKQVYIEARFVELGNAASHKVGIDWSMLGGMKGTVTLGGGINQYNVGSGVTEFTKTTGGSQYENTTYSVDGSHGQDGSITYFTGTLGFSDMYLTLKALDKTEDVRTFSNPKIIVTSGKKATVDMTTKYPNVKVSAKRTEASGSTSLDLASNLEAIPGEDKFMFAREAFFSWGISLEVTPRVLTNGLIGVSIVPTISSQEGWVETGTASDEASGTISSKYPVLKVQRLQSEFTLASGTTAVIGGLSVTEERQVDSGIPLLREIPWLGPRWFGSMERVKEQKEIVVFVTVGLVDARAVRPDAGLPKNAVLGRQYTAGQKLEPGDRPETDAEGLDSLDMRLLEEQARDPLRTRTTGEGEFKFSDFVPFRKNPEYKKEKEP